MKGILTIRDPAGTLFEDTVKVSSNKKAMEQTLKRENRGAPLKVRIKSDFPNQLSCVVGKGKNKVLFDFKWLTLFSKLTGKSLWTGRFVPWSCSFKRL